jgi:hypothetical protein
LIIGGEGWSNIRIIKAKLLLFEAMSDLKVNFHKSSLVGININKKWIKEVVAVFNTFWPLYGASYELSQPLLALHQSRVPMIPKTNKYVKTKIQRVIIFHLTIVSPFINIIIT